jgi:hypothetical protein
MKRADSSDNSPLDWLDQRHPIYANGHQLPGFVAMNIAE